MTKEEEIAAIKEAAKIYPKSQIDIAGKGKAVKKLFDGEGVTELKIDEMFVRTQKLYELTHTSSQKEITQAVNQEANQEKKNVTQSCYTNKEKAESSIEPSKKGKSQSIEEIKQAIVTQSEQIKALQEGFSQVLSGLSKIAKQDTVTQTSEVTQANEIKKLWECMNQMLSLTKKEDERTTQIEEKLKSISVTQPVTQAKTKAITQKVTQKTDKTETSVLGFGLCQKSTITNGKKYIKWYASKRIDSKQVWVYLGENTQEAESKIKAWLEKHPEVAVKLAGQSV